MNKLLLTLLLTNSLFATTNLHLGIFAYRDKEKVLLEYTPLISYLNSNMKNTTIVAEVLTEKEIEDKLEKKELDIVLTNPASFVRILKNNLLTGAIATKENKNLNVKNQFIGGVIVVSSNNSNIETIKDIKGKRIGFAGKEQLGGYQSQAYEILKAGIDITKEDTLIPFENQDIVLKKLQEEKVDVAFVRTGFLEQLFKEKQIHPFEFKVLNEKKYKDMPYLISTQLYPEWPVAVSPILDKKIANDLTNLLMNYTGDDFIAGFTLPQDYQSVISTAIELNLPPFDKKNISLLEIYHQYKEMIILIITSLFLLTSSILLLLKFNKKLKEKEEQVSEILKLSPVAVRITNQDKLVFSNKAYDNFIIPFNDSIPEHIYSKEFQEIKERILKGESIFHEEMSIIKEDIVYWVLASYMPIEFHKKKSILSWFYDITESKKLALELSIEKEFTDTLIRQTNAFIVVIKLDGTVVFLNQYGENFIGFKKEDLNQEVFDWSNIFKNESDAFHLFKLSINNENLEKYRCTLLSKSGEERIFEWSTSLIHNSYHEKLVFLVGFDLTENELKTKELKTIFDISRDGIAILDLEGTFLEFNNAYEKITGLTREELLHTNCISISREEDQENAKYAIKTAIKNGYFESFEKTLILRNGTEVILRTAISLMPDKKRLLISTKDITKMKKYEQQLKTIAHYDTLTNLPNRFLFSEKLREAMMIAKNNESMIAVAYLDLDGFKEINDTYGHLAGDQLLINISSRMQHTLRDGDIIARLGGDEFVAIFSNIDARMIGDKIGHRLLEAASMPVLVNGKEEQLSASIGIAFYPQQYEIDADTLLREADQAMYEAKLRGKNQIVLFEDISYSSYGLGEGALSIKRALKNKEFFLVYQPKVNMRTGMIIGAEALIRWDNPDKGIIYPDSFLSIVDNRPLMYEIDKWVFKTALEQMKEWKSLGYSFELSINMSPFSLKQDDFLEYIDSIIQDNPKIAESIELEILESNALHKISDVKLLIYELHKRGFRVALDDFGTGYSSLSYLKGLSIDTLKIDKSFIKDLLVDTDDLSIVDAAIGLAEAFHAEIIAEGVETEEHGKVLIELGCDVAQGYIISKPILGKDFIEWVYSWKVPEAWIIKGREISENN